MGLALSAKVGFQLYALWMPDQPVGALRYFSTRFFFSLLVFPELLVVPFPESYPSPFSTLQCPWASSYAGSHACSLALTHARTHTVHVHVQCMCIANSGWRSRL